VKRDVTYYIRRLLYRYDCVIVPDLGGFVGSYQSARILTAIQTIKPPYKKISFNIHLNNNDGLLANEIAYGEKIDYEAARDIIHRFVDDCVRRMAGGESVRLEHIGDLFYDEEQNLQYKSVHDTNYLKSSYGLGSMRLEKMAEVKTKKEEAKKVIPIKKKEEIGAVEAVAEVTETSPFNWKIAAVLIPLIGLIGYGYMERTELNELYHQYSRIGIYLFDKQEQYEARDNEPAGDVVEEELESPWFEEHLQANQTESESMNEESDAEISDSEEAMEIADSSIPEEEEAIDDEVAENLIYHVVAGCFGESGNATKLEGQLQGLGYADTYILDQKHKGLSVVVYNSFSNREAAREMLIEVQQEQQSDAWLLKK
jgi:hypothetical protein